MQDLIDYFENCIPLSEESKDLILTTVELITINKNTIVVKEGEENKFMYIIKKGLVKAYYSKNGEDITISLWMENDSFGDLVTYITGKPAVKSYITIEDTQAYKINTQKFRELFETSLEICNLGRLIAERYIVKTEFFKNALINKTVEEKYNFLIKHRPEIIKRVKLKDIASYLNMSPETLSRLRKDILMNGKTV